MILSLSLTPDQLDNLNKHSIIFNLVLSGHLHGNFQFLFNKFLNYCQRFDLQGILYKLLTGLMHCKGILEHCCCLQWKHIDQNHYHMWFLMDNSRVCHKSHSIGQETNFVCRCNRPCLHLQQVNCMLCISHQSLHIGDNLGNQRFHYLSQKHIVFSSYKLMDFYLLLLIHQDILSMFHL